MKVSVARNLAEIDRLQSAWNFLQSRADGATMFQSFAWNRIAASCFGSRESPFVVYAESDSSAALLPAALTREGLVFLGEALFDYRDSLSLGSGEALRAAWARLAESRLPLSVAGLRGEAVRHRWATLLPDPFVAAPQVLGAEISAETFAAAHSRMGRTLRRLFRQGALLRLHDGAPGSAIAWIYKSKAIQFQGTANNIFADPQRVQFMVMACASKPDACEVFTCQISGKPIAALVTFIDKMVRRFYTVWFDATWAQFSPGTALVYEVTRRTLAAGLNCDYMTGEQPHKTRFATSAVPLFRVQANAKVLARAFQVGEQAAA